MSCGRPPAKKSKRSSPISMLNDCELEEIFNWLPPRERLIAAEVCRRWHGFARKSSLQVKFLDLRPLWGRQINAVLKQCPNVKSVFAEDRCFQLRELSYLGKRPSLSSIKFYRCMFAVEVRNNSGIIPGVFSDAIQKSPCTEFIMHDALFHADVKQPNLSVIHAGHLPASLTHLQLSNLRLDARFFDENIALLECGLERLENLECFILLDVAEDDDENTVAPIARRISSTFYDLCGKRNDGQSLKVCCLKNLKKLCIGAPFCLLPDEFDNLLQCLPKLQVLFIHTLRIMTSAEYNMQAIASSASLRILVLMGYTLFISGVFPVRKRYPNGFGEDPLPLQHIFVGKGASESIRFEKSDTNAAIVHPINQPFPEILERDDIAPIFKGIWVAERIKETAKYGGQLWDHKSDDTAISAL